MTAYELVVLGEVDDERLERLTRHVSEMVGDFGLKVGSDIRILRAADVPQRDIRVACAGVYFAGPTQADAPEAQLLLDSRVPIIPVLRPGTQFEGDVPACLAGANGFHLDATGNALTAVATALLECLGLLRAQRRVFVSYRRIEAREAAIQIHDSLSGTGFEVFLDTHDIRPGDTFQDALWHRLCDCDVLVMLDTPTYFESKWTRQELGRALAKDIQILRVLWPEHEGGKLTELAETIVLTGADIKGRTGPLAESVMAQVSVKLERLRSRSIAARYTSIVGRFRAEVARIGAQVEHLSAYRAMKVKLFNGKVVWAYPVVGIPTAELLNDVARRATDSGQAGIPILLYDHVGIRDGWVQHLKWLDKHIAVVRAVRVAEAAWSLVEWPA